MMTTKHYLLIISFLVLGPIVAVCQNNLQALVDKAKAKGVLKLDPNRVYILEHPLVIPDGFRLIGNGTVIRPVENWRKKNEKNSPLIEIIKGKSISIENLTIDNMASRGLLGMPAYSMLILASSKIKVSNVTFKDLGLPISSKEVAGFPFVLIIAQEAANDFSYITNKGQKVIGSVSDVEIANCKFINTNYVNSFALRMLTLWTKKRDRKLLRSRISNVTIRDNLFSGEYDWNTIEAAGPATTNINILSNTINGKSTGNIDVDKGASQILISGNVIKNAGLPTRHKLNKNVRVSPISVHGSETSYACEDVEISNNRIDGVINPPVQNSRYTYSSGIGVWYANNVRIRNNTITNLFPNKNYGTGICLDQSLNDISVYDNNIDGVYWGITITPNTHLFSNVQIRKNNIQSKAESLLLLNGNRGRFDGLVVEGNKVRSERNQKLKIGTKIRNITTDLR